MADLSNPTPGGKPLREVITYFTKLGFTAFGGPAAHVAMMEDELVHRRKWIDRQHFLDLVSAINFIPGPNSTELAIHLGLIRAGWRGLIAAGVCFITPAVLIILPLAWAYVRWGALPRASPVLAAIGAAVVAVVSVALWRFFRSSVRSRFTAGIMIFALVAILLLKHFRAPQAELIVLGLAAGAGAIRGGLLAAALRRSTRMFSFLPFAAATTLPAALPHDPTLASNLLAMSLMFLKIGATLFGSGYVLISFLQAGFVDGHHWLTDAQLRDAVSVGQFTPGPLLTTATFIGYVVTATHFGGGTFLSILGAVLATVAIFLPSFVLIALTAPALEKIRKNPAARSTLDALNAAVVALLAAVVFEMSRSLLIDNPTTRWLLVSMMIVSLACLLLTKINPTWLILICGVVGLIDSFL